ncbi:MAG: DUF1491 family protein [Sphingobium phenoxybenzoativorans]
MLAGALIRRAGQEGGFAAVLRKGDAISGVILVQCLERGRKTGLFERVPDFSGGYHMAPCGPADDSDPDALTQYIARRMRPDPDLWLIELDISEAERFAAETIC